MNAWDYISKVSEWVVAILIPAYTVLYIVIEFECYYERKERKQIMKDIEQIGKNNFLPIKK